MSVVIELITPSASEQAVALLEAQLREHDIETPRTLLREVVERVCSDPREGFILLARLPHVAEPVGIAFAAAHLSAEHGGIIGWLEELYVSPEYRGSGAGSALLREVMVHAQERHWRAIELEVVQGHERVVALYERNGFTNAQRSRYTRLLAPDHS
jgi:GNAT superfamily N-acetyltransferase